MRQGTIFIRLFSSDRGPGHRSGTRGAAERFEAATMRISIYIASLHVSHGLSAHADMNTHIVNAGFLKPENEWFVHRGLSWNCEQVASMRIFVRAFGPDFRKRLGACSRGSQLKPAFGPDGAGLNRFFFKPKQKILHNTTVLERDSRPSSGGVNGGSNDVHFHVFDDARVLDRFIADLLADDI